MSRQEALVWGLGMLMLGVGLLQSPGVRAETANSPFDQAIASAHRDPANRERDRYRHPKETLSFFGLKPDMTVVEIWPAAGWYTEILAPLLRDKGTYYAATFMLTADTPEYTRNTQQAFLDKIAKSPDLYDRVKVTQMGAGSLNIAPAGSADLVLTFRNVHNWMKAGFAQDAFKAFYQTLKPGGVLGVVEHRAKPGSTPQQMIDTGYVTEDQVIAYAKEAGLVLEDKSDVNANPADNKDHPQGVWTLPPGFALCRDLKAGPELDECKGPWQAIGESDRMTLRFRKPAK